MGADDSFSSAAIGGKGTLRMKAGIRFIRRLSMAGLVFGGIIFGAVPVIVPVGAAYAQAGANIVVEGNRRVEASTVRSYFKPGPDGRLGPLQIDDAYKALIGTGLFQDVRIDTAGGRIRVFLVENAVI